MADPSGTFMLDHLKKEQIQGFGAKERTRLMMLVGVLLVMAAVIVGAQSCEGTAPGDGDADRDLRIDPSQLRLAPELDKAVLGPKLVDAAFEGDGEARVERTNTFLQPSIDHLRLHMRAVPSGQIATRTTVEDFRKLSPQEHLGDILEVQGTVIDVAQLAYQNERNRLWVYTLEDDAGRVFLSVRHALTSDARGGQPTDSLRRRGPSPLIEEGHEVIVRGIYLQRRTGTIGEIALREAAPVLYATSWRIAVPLDERPPTPETLADIPFETVRDWLEREAEQLQSVDALHQILIWARARGYEAIKQDIKSGAIPHEAWDQARFKTWQQEVLLRDRAKRVNTQGWRGKVFSTSGLVGDINREGWGVVPPNRWGVDNLFLFDLMSDYYATMVLRNVLAFSPETYDGFRAHKGDHVRVYGVFLKNYQYRLKKSREGEAPDSPRNRIVMPSFVVLHIEPIDTGTGDQTIMWIVAGAIVLMGLLFYFVLIRGEGRQAKAFEATRIERKKQRRARAKERRTGREPPPDEGAENDAGS